MSSTAPLADESDEISDIFEAFNFPDGEVDAEGFFDGNDKIDVAERVPAIDILRRYRVIDHECIVIKNVSKN
jgi:hypothetical protein